MRSAGLPSALVVIPTLGRRPLERLLSAVDNEIVQLRGSGVGSVVVLHNAPQADPGLRGEVEAAGATYRLVERVGYATVRNVGLREAAGHSYVIFIDDDEVPCTGWLRAHFEMMEQWNADVVFGPVRVSLPPGSPRWLNQGRLLRDPPSYRSGPVEGPVYSGNTSIRVSSIGSSGSMTFDPAYDRSGGEDTDFFTKMKAGGALIVWSNEAEVVEEPDPDRLKLASVVRRTWITSRGSAIYRLTVEGERRNRVAFHSSLRLLIGVARLLSGIVTLRSDRAAKALRDVTISLGGLSSLTSPQPARTKPALREERKGGYT